MFLGCSCCYYYHYYYCCCCCCSSNVLWGDILVKWILWPWIGLEDRAVFTEYTVFHGALDWKRIRGNNGGKMKWIDHFPIGFGKEKWGQKE